MAYAIDSICGSPSFKSNERTCQKLGQHVSYFSCGVCNGKSLVVFMKKKGMDSQFKAIEPICGDLRDPKNTKFKTGRSGFLSKSHEWFKTYKVRQFIYSSMLNWYVNSLRFLEQEFYVGANSTSVQFLKARLIVVCDKGFEIVDLENLNMNRNLPDLTDTQFNFVNAKGDQLQPLSMFRMNGKFLLCYNEFAFYINNHGNLAEAGKRYVPMSATCDPTLLSDSSSPNSEPIQFRWEGTPQDVILYHSYVIAFDPNFIEIRNSETVSTISLRKTTFKRSGL